MNLESFLYRCFFGLFVSLGLLNPACSGEEVVPRTVHDILAAIDQLPVDHAQLAAARAVLDTPVPEGLSRTGLADFHHKRGRAAMELGLVGAQLTELRKAMDSGGGAYPWRVLQELAVAEYLAGNFRSAIDLTMKSQINATQSGMGGAVFVNSTLLSTWNLRLGDMETALRHARDADAQLTLLKRWSGWPDYESSLLSSANNMFGRIDMSAGRLADAEARFRRALDYAKRDVPFAEIRLSRYPQAPPKVTVENKVDYAELSLVDALVAQSRLAEAELHARYLVKRAIERTGQDSVHSLIMIWGLARVLFEQDRLAETLLLVDRGLNKFSLLGVPSTAYVVAQYRRLKAGALSGQGQFRDAIGEFEALKAALADDPQLAEAVGAPATSWVLALLGAKRDGEALALAENLASQLNERMGRNAYDAAEALGFYGVALAANHRISEAFDALKAALDVLGPKAVESTERSGRRFRHLNFIAEHYLAVLLKLQGSPDEKLKGINASAEAFVVADMLRGQSVQQAMLASSSRAASGNPELAKLVRDEQDLRQERDSTLKILADLMSRPVEQLLPQVIAKMQVRVSELDGALKLSGEAIRNRFPDYADLISPRPARVEHIQSVLRPGEVLMSILPGDGTSFVWAVPAKGDMVFAKVNLGKEAIMSMVDRLRKAVDPGDVDLSRLPAYDGETAFGLFHALLQPVMDVWRGSPHLIVVAGGSLTRLPFGMLLTAPPPAKHDYSEWPWLIREAAISHLPAASSLITLRRMKPSAQDRFEFAGFGDPDFQGTAKVTVSGTQQGLRKVAIPLDLRGAALRGDNLGWIDYAHLSPLPETREEILALAQVLGADTKRDVFLGSSASRDSVLQADLGRRKVIAFATHGLVRGEFPGVDQPALALANPGGGKHGLLTLNDILGLKLDADWVVLSACNTAAGDGSGAEAVSGLGRAFFYAGSRSLLVTHWPVESASAKWLVVGIFERLSKNPGLSRAEALRQSMLAQLKRGEFPGKINVSYGHPLFWAPYVLVGDGAK